METEKKKELDENLTLKQAREHFREARRTMYKRWEKSLPEGFIEDHRKIRREMLLGIRDILDYAIEKSDKRAKES